MGILGRIFGAPDAVKEVVTSIRDGMDALVYTNEEKEKDAATERQKGREILIGWMQATSGQNLARRYIAVLITSTWTAQFLMAMVLSLFAVWAREPMRWQQSATIVGNFADQMSGAVMLILGFYFAAPHLGQIVTGAMDAFKGKRGVKPTD